MSVERLRLRLTGERPLLMHSRLADPLDPIKVDLDRLTKKRDKTIADHEQIAKVEWYVGLWLTDSRPCVPSEAIESAFVAAARTRRKGKIDFVLADLVGRATVRLRPLLLVGDPGGGKSRFARRLGEVLGVSVWRTDASRSDGAVFAGTDRRWYSAEPCHPFLAIGRAKHANPLVLLDELEKASTRADYGRLWDCLLGFLEPETNARYPDPALQITLDLSQVNYIATANSLDPLPSPIRDRFRVITFPKPTANDLDALLPAVITDLVGERGLDSRWVAPLDGTERMAVATHWRGGSVRRLRRLVEAILRERDLRAARN